MKLLFTFLLLCLSALQLPYFQKVEEPSALVGKAELWHAKYLRDVQRARELGIPLYKRSEGVTYAFAGFAGDDRPLYIVTTAVEHARTISATRVWPGYDLGLSLSGSGITVGQWEAPSGNSAHPDTSDLAISGRITVKDTPYAVSAHATSVTHILAGSGSDSSKVGIAHGAEVDAYDFNNVLLELAKAALAGLLVSNHSYAYNVGWSGSFWNGLEEIDSTEDYNFGLYNTVPARMDSIAYLAPYHLPVISAGNDRGQTFNGNHSLFQSVNGSTTQFNTINSNISREVDGGLDGYDCLNPLGTAKNALVIGSVNFISNGWQDTSDVVLHASSSRGPTDDGRIKPDLVAGGSPTSFAAPAIAGGIALLQEHYYNLFGRYMLASTARALLIHTADESGLNPGPDYDFGWGLPNIGQAAVSLSSVSDGFLIFEDTLSNSSTQLYHIYIDSSEIKLTLAWTDPAGNPVTFTLDSTMLNNRTSMLVNDLDIRLERREDNNIYFPWRLNVDQPFAAASRGDNITDNIEQIVVNEAVNGWYIVTVSHKGNLMNSKQVYSLLISGGHQGLIWEGTQWNPSAPDATTSEKDVLILENTRVTLPANFKANRLRIENGAKLEVQ